MWQYRRPLPKLLHEMNNYWAFLPLQASNDLLGDPAALRSRMAEDGYLYFSKLLDPPRIRSLRKQMLLALADHGWVARGGYYLAGYDDVQRLEEFHTLAHDETLVDTMRQVLGDTAFPHPLKIARLSFPD